MALSTAIRRSLYGKMSGDTTLSNLLGTAAPGYTKAIYNDAAPEESGYPLIVFAKHAGTPTYTMAASAGKFESDVWRIMAIDRNTTADPAEAIQARLDVLLTDGTLTISGATQMLIKRESDVEYLEVQDGQRFYHRGSLFRVLYQ